MYKKMLGLVLAVILAFTSFGLTSASPTPPRGDGAIICNLGAVKWGGFVEGPEGSEFSFVVSQNAEIMFEESGVIPQFEHLQFDGGFLIPPGNNEVEISWSVVLQSGQVFSNVETFNCPHNLFFPLVGKEE